MNWKKLKEKFPKSEIEIREHFLKTDISCGRALINNFLESKGYTTTAGFINELRQYENKLKTKQ
tara:strand:- start:84 stop:275 length:192 start_codon:yes stop_codon:yes gene_type:complete